MSRYRPQKAYGHHIQSTSDPDWFRISWTVDRYYTGSQLRFPTATTRNTDLAGAKRFAKKHGLTVPGPKPPLRSA